MPSRRADWALSPGCRILLDSDYLWRRPCYWVSSRLDHARHHIQHEVHADAVGLRRELCQWPWYLGGPGHPDLHFTHVGPTPALAQDLALEKTLLWSSASAGPRPDDPGDNVAARGGHFSCDLTSLQGWHETSFFTEIPDHHRMPNFLPSHSSHGEEFLRELWRGHEIFSALHFGEAAHGGSEHENRNHDNSHQSSHSSGQGH
jgi:hypothetical protein